MCNKHQSMSRAWDTPICDTQKSILISVLPRKDVTTTDFCGLLRTRPSATSSRPWTLNCCRESAAALITPESSHVLAKCVLEIAQSAALMMLLKTFHCAQLVMDSFNPGSALGKSS